MTRIVFVASLMLLTAACAFAQGSSYSNIVLSATGQPVAGATITVCTSAASGTPCSPLAALFTDRTLTVPSSDPFVADGLGNYHFYAAPGRYQVQVSGPGISTFTMLDVILPSDPSSAASGNNVSAFSLNLGGNLTVGGSATVSGSTTLGNVTVTGTCSGPGCAGASSAQKPNVNDLICYVSPNGNDANDGLSWGTAKKTIMDGCYDTLFANTQYGAGNTFVGAIHIAQNSSCSATAGVGIWILDGIDPNASNPPAGWRKEPHSGGVLFIGDSYISNPQNNHGTPAAPVNCGSSTNADLTHPAVWLSGTNVAIRFESLAFSSCTPVKIGIDSNNSRNTGTGAVAWAFAKDFIGVTNPNTAGCGPAMDIGSNVFFGEVSDSTFGADVGNTFTNDNAASILMNPGASTGGVGVIKFEWDQLNGGGVVQYADAVSYGGFYSHIFSESLPTGQPLLYEKNNTSAMAVEVDTIQTFDSFGGPAIKCDNSTTAVGGIPQNMLVSGIVSGGPAFPAVQCQAANINNNGSYNSGNVQNFEQQGEIGFAGSHIVGQFDASRRTFGTSNVLFTNFAAQVPSASTWNIQGDQSLTLVTGPDRNTANLAGQVSTTHSGIESVIFASKPSFTASVGDAFVVGSWIRSQTANAFSNSQPISAFAANNGVVMGCGVSGATSGSGLTQYLKGDGEWEWEGFVCLITTGASNVNFTANYNVDSTHTIVGYAPIAIYIPTGTLSTNEIYSIAEHLKSWPDTLSAGTESTLRGTTLSFGGSGNFFATLTHSNSANRTYTFPDSSGIVAELLTGTTTSLGGSSLSANTCTSATVSIAGATTSMSVMATPAIYPGDGFAWYGYVSSSGTVTVKVCNRTDSSATPTASAYNVRVIQ
ncbi:MAG: carboxypeptidase-like regulatory domain-containing protein [Candidatus Acidiferrales bacterium]